MPGKKKRAIPKSGPVWHRSSEQATLDQMPKYNAHACGTGPHGDAKYNRAKQKRNWQREIARESARSRGRFPFLMWATRGMPCIRMTSRKPKTVWAFPRAGS